MRTWILKRSCFALLLIVVAALFLQPAPAAANEYRAWWIEGWNSPGFLNQGEVDDLLGVPGVAGSLGDIRKANCNMVIVEVRRSADVCYESGMGEPYFSGLTPAEFDALQAIIDAAHDTTGGKKRIEVHAWLVVFRTDANSVFAAHHDTPTGDLVNLDNYWVSRIESGGEITGDQPFDPGHPLVEDYITDVFMDIANNYDIDGVHYDYIRFTGSTQGYNPTSVARYNNRFGLSGNPASANAQWKQWRRDQVTNVVRRIYHRMQIVKPSVKVSGAFSCGSPGPSTPNRNGFITTPGLQAYNSSYQDWDSWMREGIVDMAVPMTYFDLAGAHLDDWNWWLEYQKDNKCNRHMITGPGTYLNSKANAISQLQQIRTPSAAGNYANGFSGYDYQVPYAGGTWGDDAVTTSWAYALRTQVTPTWADVPEMTWKTAPTKGHLHGTVFNGGRWVDGAHITTTAGGDQLTDGTGFYGFADVTPGTYTVTCDATAQGLGTQTKSFTIVAGQVTVVNFTWGTTTGMSGYVRTSAGTPVAGARIVGANGAYVSTSGADGSYTLPGMTAGTYTFKASKTGYTPHTRSATITAGATAGVDFTLNPESGSGGMIAGYVRDSMSHGVAGATVATGSGGYSTLSSSDGSYALWNVAPGAYSVTASMPSYTSQTFGNVTVSDGVTTPLSFTIDPDWPVITSVTATDIGQTSARITWTTNVPATSRVEYGPTRSMGTLTSLDSNLVTSHSVTLSGLTQNHIYHYRVTSANSLGQSVTSGRYIFFTLPPASGGQTYIIDNVDAGWAITLGTWITATPSTDKYGANYCYKGTVTGDATASCSWTPNIPSASTYDVYIWYPQGDNRANDAPFTINYNGGTVTVNVNQQANGGTWNLIASAKPFAAGTGGNVTLTNHAQDSKVVMADAVKFVSTGASDTTPPTIPTGLSAAATSTTQIQLSWTASSDSSGVAGYKIYRAGVLVDAVTSGVSYTDIELLPNTSYSYTVAAYDPYGNTSSQSSAVARATLCLPITSGSITCDRPASVWQTASDIFTFTNNVGFGGATIDHIRYVWDHSATHTWSNSETSWSSGTKPCQASPGGNNWYLHARAYNPDNVPNGQIDLGPYWCDITAPSSPVPTVVKYVTVTDQLSCNWTTSTDGESGLAEYQYKITTAPGGGTTIKDWTTNGTSTTVTVTSLTLVLDQPYYFSVKARNGAGTWSVARISTSTIPAHVCASIAEAKVLANDCAVVLSNRHCGYADGNGAFIQDPNRAAALYVPAVTVFGTDNIVNIAGILGTAGLDRILTSTDPQSLGGPAGVKPLMMTFASLGGTQLNEWTPGMPGARGANNLGLLVRVWGHVTTSTSTHFMLSDGLREIKVQSTVNLGSGYVIVTGISSWTVYNSQTIPMIITRYPQDVRTL